MDITRWSVLKSDRLHSLQPRMERNSTQLAKARPGADSGSDHGLLVANYRLKMNKVGKTIFRYDLNQITYDYTVEVTNRLDLVDRVPENYGQRFITSYGK